MKAADAFAGLAAAILISTLSSAFAAELGVVQWIETPSAALDPLGWPERALRLEVDGEATLRCGYDGQGVLSDCSVVSENPPAFGFGVAALRMSKVFRLQSRLSDGSALTPGEITFPVQFVAASDFRDPRQETRPAPKVGSREAPIRIAKPDQSVFPNGQPPAIFPERALVEEKPGAATIRCLVAADGHLTRCSVISETAKGYGYGKAAIALSQYFRMNPTMADGTPLAGKWISLLQHFRLQ